MLLGILILFVDQIKWTHIFHLNAVKLVYLQSEIIPHKIKVLVNNKNNT